MNAAVDLFTEEMREAGLDPAELPTADGVFRRIRDNQDKPGKKDLYYILHGDGIPAGNFGHWSRLPDGQNWQAKPDNTLTPQERTHIKERIEQSRAARDKARDEVRAACRIKAGKMLEAAQDVSADHAYLVKKSIKPYGGRQLRDMLLIPVRKGKALTGLQIIMPDGSKKFLTGTEKAGAYLVIKGKGKTVYLTEGWATGCTIHELTGATVIVCYDCQNLEAVSSEIRAKGPDYDMVMVADNDRLTAGNPGLTKARAAALATGARLAIPDFPGDDGTDANDLAEISGAAAVISCLEAAAMCDTGTAATATTKTKKQRPKRPPTLPDRFTDQQLKYLFADKYKHVVRYVPGIGWHRWDGSRWCTDIPGGLYPLIDEMQQYLMREAAKIEDADDRLKQRKALIGLESHDRQSTVIRACEHVPGLITPASQLDQDGMLVNCHSGTIDLKTGVQKLHDPADLITRIINIEYDPYSTAPTFLKFITWAMQGDMELVSYLQRFIGYCLTGDTSEQVLNFWYGTGGNGKSTLMNVVQWLLCDYGTCAETSLIMKGDSTGTDGNRLYMLAALRGARLVTLSEVNDGQKLDEAQIKSFTGGDVITARHIYKDPFSYIPQSKLIGFGNYKPHVRGTDHGIWRRIHLVPFKAVIPDADKDPHLPQKLRAELPGILAWAVRGCLDWQRVGLSPPAAILNAVQEYRQNEDTFKSWLTECCSLDDTKRTPAAELIASFREFSGWRNLSERKFGEMLAGNGFHRIRSGGSKWIGISLEENGHLDTWSLNSQNPIRKTFQNSLGKNAFNCPSVHYSEKSDIATIGEIPDFDV